MNLYLETLLIMHLPWLAMRNVFEEANYIVIRVFVFVCLTFVNEIYKKREMLTFLEFWGILIISSAGTSSAENRSSIQKNCYVLNWAAF